MPRRKKQPVVETQESFDNAKVELTKPKVKKPSSKTSTKPTIKKEDNSKEMYNIFPLYKKYFQDDRNAYHAGSIIARAMADFYNRADLYIGVVDDKKIKEEIKKTLVDDLRLFIKHIKKL